MGDKEALDYFFAPRNIAVVGASNVEGKMGNIFMRHLLTGFPGTIFPVHPTEQEIIGLAAYPDLSAIPGQIDLIIPLIPSKQLITLLKSCSNGQAKFMLAITSGFGEVPEGGKLLEQELIGLAKERNIRVVGPNTAGMLNCTYGLNASMMPELPPGGSGFSCITQSGGFGMAIYMYTLNHQLEMAKFCDLGNTADVSVSESLNYLCYDEDTRIIGLFLESVPEDEAFFTQASEVAAVKPVILTKLGRTTAGQRASFAHIGINSDGTIIKETKEGGKESKIIPAQTGIEMLNIAEGLSWQPLPKGKKVGIITGSGGVGAELTDLCLEHGLEVPELSRQLQDALRPYLPSYTSVQNPVDLTPLWWDYYKIYPPLIQTLFASDEVDLLIVTVIDIGATQEKLMHSLVETVSPASAKPLYVYWASTYNELQNMSILEGERIPCYQSTLETVRVAAAISRYAR